MMGSTDAETVKLGWTMLSQFDFSLNHEKYALILLRCRMWRYIPKTREYGLLRKDIKEKYPLLNI
jgi:hypothetical protein